MKTYKDEIFQTVGEIIELIQYIEWNLCLELEIDGFSNYTWGQIKNMILEADIFDEESSNDLIVILERRNDLVHKYFKRLDFVAQSENYGFLVNQRNYLRNFLQQVQEFNDLLVED
jgi:hypothetical protein